MLQDCRETPGHRLERGEDIRGFLQEIDGESCRGVYSRLPIRLVLVCSGRIDNKTREFHRLVLVDIGNGGVIVGSRWNL